MAPTDVYGTARSRTRARIASPIAARARTRRHAQFFGLTGLALGMRVLDVGCGTAGLRARYPDAFLLSAKRAEDVAGLRVALEAHFASALVEREIPREALSVSGYWKRTRTDEQWRQDKAEWNRLAEQDVA